MKCYVEQIIKSENVAVIINDSLPIVVNLELLPKDIKETDILEYHDGKYLISPNNLQEKAALNEEIATLLKKVVKPMPKK